MIIKSVKVLFILSATIVLIASCSTYKTSLSKIENEKVKSILVKAMDTQGGYNNWYAIKQLRFNKWYALYKEDGAEELSMSQEHNYRPAEIQMSWTDKHGKIIEQKQIDNRYTKLIDGQIDPNSTSESVKNSILASTFVMNIPFNLLDESAALSYEGIQEFNNQQAHVIKAVYSPNEYAHHTTEDIWWHYFDTTDYSCLGYKVKHLDHISLIYNTSWYDREGFKLIDERESYRVNDQSEILWTRAKYKYSDYEIN